MSRGRAKAPRKHRRSTLEASIYSLRLRPLNEAGATFGSSRVPGADGRAQVAPGIAQNVPFMPNAHCAPYELVELRRAYSGVSNW